MTDHDRRMQDAFIQQILAAPNDLFPRQIYSDWLKDQGWWTWDKMTGLVIHYRDCDGFRLMAADWQEEDGSKERAEFIRVQCELTVLLANDPDLIQLDVGKYTSCGAEGCALCKRTLRYQQLRLRERELLHPTRHREWSHFPREVLPDATWDWKRGFVHSVRCRADTWLLHARTLTALQPIEVVTLTTWPDTVDVETQAFLEHIEGYGCLVAQAVAPNHLHLF